MAIFVVQADQGCFVGRGDIVTRLAEQTDFYLFAETKDLAKQFSEKYIGDRIGQGSDIARNAFFDPVGDWVTRADANPHLQVIKETISEAAHFIGSIELESYAVKSTATSGNTLMITVAEGEKRRCLLRRVSFMEDGSVEWGEEMSAFDVTALAVAIQDLF